MNEEQKNDFCMKALIPQNVSLEIENFGDFYEKRKNLLREKILALLK